MPYLAPVRTSAPPALARGISGAFQVALWFGLVLLAAVFGNLHRYGAFDLLLVVCLLIAFWVIASLATLPLVHMRSWANVFLWGILAIVLLQVLPLPKWGPIGQDSLSLGPLDAVLVGGVRDVYQEKRVQDPYVLRVLDPFLLVGRYSLRPVATVGTLVLVWSAAGLYWLVASSLVGRKAIRRGTWAAILGLVPPAMCVAVTGLAPRPISAEGVFRPDGPMLILGGDSLVPALLAALPITVAAVVRLLGWTPRLPRGARQSRWGWLVRPWLVWAAIGLGLAALVAIALGMSNVPWRLKVACVLLSVGFVLVGFVTSHRERRSPRRLCLGILVWVFAALGLGMMLGPARLGAATAETDVQELVSAMSDWRAAFGAGAGAVSPRAVYGAAGWPAAIGDDSDTSGYLVLRAEIGWVGLALAMAGAIAVVGFMVRAWRRSRGRWTRLMMCAGLGVMAANLLYFRFDASALLVPNLVALAAVLGIVGAWAAHGAAWRPIRMRREFAPSHWPLVFGAAGLIGALALAETEMLNASPSHEVNDKVLHFGAFAVVNLLLCYAFGPLPTMRWLKARVLGATAVSVVMAVMVEYAQRAFTAGRSFELKDMAAGAAGAAIMGIWWWAVRRAHVAETEPSRF